jgi:hypothetical protein
MKQFAAGPGKNPRLSNGVGAETSGQILALGSGPSRETMDGAESAMERFCRISNPSTFFSWQI